MMKASTLFLALCATAGTALAQPSDTAGPTPPSAQASNISPSEMQPQTENGITYLCGGVGLDESSAMKQAARNYDLMATFAAQDGSYLADVQVDVLGKNGAPVLQTTCDGPMLLLKLPQKGNYRIRAAVGGHAQTKSAQAGGHGTQRLVFVWPAAQAGLEQSRSMRGSQQAAQPKNMDSAN